MMAHPVDKIRNVSVSPHPRREALKRLFTGPTLRPVAYVAIDCGGVGPVGFHGDNREPMLFKQPACYGSARSIELRGAMTCLSQQHNPRLSKAVKQRAERRIF